MNTKTQTLALIKPDAVGNNSIGEVVATAEADGFRVRGMRMLEMTEVDVEFLYGEHASKSFYQELSDFMRSGPCVAMLLERDGDAVGAWRTLMGATDSTRAARGTIRSVHGSTPVYRNAVHGSDSYGAAAREADHFFPEDQPRG